MNQPSPIYVTTQVAARRDGIVGRAELLRAGLSRHQIQRQVEAGLLRPVVPGIYVLGAAALSRRQLLQVGLLRGGPGALLAGRTAAEHLGLLRPTAHPIDILAPPGHRSSQVWTRVPLAETGRSASITVRATQPPAASNVSDGLCSTSVSRTLMDLAHRAPAQVLTWAWDQAEFRGQLDAASLTQEASRPRPGSREIRDRLAVHQAINADTHFIGKDEVPFLKLLAAAGLPTPEVNAPLIIGGERRLADFLFRPEGLVVELDEPGHLKPSARDRDVLRDTEFFNAGLDVIRFLTTRVKLEPDRCMALVRGALDRNRARNTRAPRII